MCVQTHMYLHTTRNAFWNEQASPRGRKTQTHTHTHTHTHLPRIQPSPRTGGVGRGAPAEGGRTPNKPIHTHAQPMRTPRPSLPGGVDTHRGGGGDAPRFPSLSLALGKGLGHKGGDRDTNREGDSYRDGDTGRGGGTERERGREGVGVGNGAQWSGSTSTSAFVTQSTAQIASYFNQDRERM
jgi:hypothetical protein